MHRDRRFHYPPICSAPGCSQTAKFKIAASWSDGTSQELKSYGLVCEMHRLDQFDQACLRSSVLSRAADETVGPVEVFHLASGRRDAELARASEPDQSDDHG